MTVFLWYFLFKLVIVIGIAISSCATVLSSGATVLLQVEILTHYADLQILLFVPPFSIEKVSRQILVLYAKIQTLKSLFQMLAEV